MQKQAQQTTEDYSDWMKYLPDNVYLSQVSMPGSHDACTMYGSHYEYKSGMPGERYHFKWLQNVVFGYMNVTKIIKAQELSIEEQLAAGVRMFDLRPSASGSSLQDLPIHHGIAALGDPTRGGYTPGGSGRQELSPFMLSHLLDRFVNFLNEHPDETVLIHMKYENTSGTGKTGWDKSVVDLMGGSISVESATDKGTRFEVVLEFPIDAEADHAQQVQALPEEAEETSPLSGMKFLCAEDNAINAEILQMLLETKGASCTICPNGQEIVDAFANVKPGEYDMILMDVQMPVMNGYEATKAIRRSSHELAMTIPIIAMTANAFSEDIQHSLAAGMNAHVSKPVEMKVLEKTIRSIKSGGGHRNAGH